MTWSATSAILEATLKYKDVNCKTRILFTIFKDLFLFQRYFSFKNMQIGQVMKSLIQCWSTMMKDVLANLSRKCLILLDVLHNMSIPVLLPWQHDGFQTSLILKTSFATFSVLFLHLSMVPQWSSKHLNMLRRVFGLLNVKFKILKPGWETGQERVAMGTKLFLSLGV